MPSKLIETVKNNMASVVGIITSVGVVVGGYIAFDNNYVSAAEFRREQTSQINAIDALKRQTTIQID